MVLVKRRSHFSGVPIATNARGPHLPYGDNLTPQNRQSPDSVSPESGTLRSFSFDKGRRKSSFPISTLPTWMFRAIIASIAVWWFLSQYWSHIRSQTNVTISSEWETYNIVHEGSSTEITELQYFKAGLDNHAPQLQKKLHDISISSAANPEASEQPGIIDRWIKHRLTVLENKVQTLQKYIQEESRKQVIEKFGPGPTYRVKFTVELIRAKSTKSFTVETAQLDLVPHSIRVFLETVNHGLWDNTVFWHHDDIDHVISSATVVYSTGMPNHHYFDALGLRGVSFAEYSSEFPHTKYSLGFANRGPVFYINTMDNTDLHGPGGQGHHDLPDEADPCFGRVVLGFDVVDEMLKLSLEPKTEQGEHRDWHQYDLTHIKSAEILHEW